jgi:hypothetical protein
VSKPDLCGSSDAPIPCGGSVRCLCGIHWADHDKRGEPRFRVPLHDRRGHLETPEKLAARIDRECEARRRRNQERAFKEALEVARRLKALELLEQRGEIPFGVGK